MSVAGRHTTQQMQQIVNMREWQRSMGLRVVVVLGVVLLLSAKPAGAQITPQHRKELTALRSEVSKVAGLVHRKQFDEADAALKATEEKLNDIAKAAGVSLEDKALAPVAAQINKQREALAKIRARLGPATAAADGIVFSRDVAPIIAGQCLECHGVDNPRANLRLDTFAGWKRGGKSGPLLIVGNSANSLLIAAVSATDAKQRMPKGGDPLSKEQIKTLSDWINGGARYDGKNEDLSLADVMADAPLDPSIVIPKPKGTETVSFKRDIAPFMANLCGGCHSRARRSGGLCLETFYDMLKGGDSGVVVVPGKREESRLFRLTGGLESPRMPQGPARITRKNYQDLIKWFDEGCVYDGDDPKTPLREFVRSDADVAAEKFAAMSADELAKLRVQRTREQFKAALPNDTAQVLETQEFYLIGNVPAERLEQAADWGAAHAEKLRKLFSDKENELWKGRLAVFVLKDRFSYDEFNLVIEKREAPRELTGHSVVKPTFEDAYVALLDVGDESGNDAATLHVNLIDHLTGAYLKRGGSRVPLWVQRGLGLSLAAQAIPGDKYLRQMPKLARQQVGALGKPSEIFADGTFSPSALPPVAYTLVDYMLDVGGVPRFGQFVAALEAGKGLAEALRTVYATDAEAAGRGGMWGRCDNAKRKAES
ncbi:MAG: c-type cytochrome domain-containing protein [Planctomycetaceae bacterium]